MRTYRIQGPDGQFSLAVTEEAVQAYAAQGHVGPGTLLQDCLTGEQFYAGQHPLLAGFFAPAIARPIGPPPSSGSTGRIVAIVALCVLVVGVGIAVPFMMLGRAVQEVGRQFTQSHMALSQDGVSQVTLPFGWTQAAKSSNEDAVLEANSGLESSMVIITEPRKDYDFGLERYSEVTRKAIAEKQSGAKISGPRKLTINGCRAIQYELRGSMDGEKVVTLHTCVETARRFHQIIVATTPSTYDEEKEELKGIIASFREVGK
jgi:hypothetical protein